MRRVVVIGATGHIGSYLVPRLVRGGHEVIAMSRGTRDPYHASPQWNSVTRVTVDREAQDAEGTFGARIAALRPDVVIDLVCFTADPTVWTSLATGRPLALPDHGLGVLHHVHADDVAQAFERALSRSAAIGASFHVVAEQAMTLRGLATGVARWFGREPVLDFVDWAEFDRRVVPEHAEATRQHTFRSITASIVRAREALGYAPRYSSLDALHEALAWLVANGQADVGGQQFPRRNLLGQNRAGEPGRNATSGSSGAKTPPVR